MRLVAAIRLPSWPDAGCHCRIPQIKGVPLWLNPRLTRAEAPRQSMLALMTKHAVDPATKQNLFSYSHPAFWAPFALIGDSGAR